MSDSAIARVGAVVIGRNEGDRLERCLRSLLGRVSPLVYVDSQSTDGSPELARQLGAEVVELDLSTPFTAARARNAGLERLRTHAPDTEFVQFVDGDCEVVSGWIEIAKDALQKSPALVAVTGVRRERYPEQSWLNEVCDVEWRQGAYGETTRFGGDVMVRLSAIVRIGGYNPSVIAAEDDECAIRLCASGGRVLRVESTMTIHDAAMHHLSQWWQRAKRCGYGYAQVGALHGARPVYKFRVERRRALVWGALLPTTILAFGPASNGISLLLVAVYPLRAMRIARSSRRSGFSRRASVAWGVSCAFSAVPEAVGVFKYHLDRLRRTAPRIIEYKEPKPQ